MADPAQSRMNGRTDRALLGRERVDEVDQRPGAPEMVEPVEHVLGEKRRQRPRHAAPAAAKLGRRPLDRGAGLGGRQGSPQPASIIQPDPQALQRRRGVGSPSRAPGIRGRRSRARPAASASPSSARRPRRCGSSDRRRGRHRAGRSARARRLTAPDNPWFAANIVNRIWYWLMGSGIVNEPDDMRPTNPPTNPELLTYLQKELVDSHYDLRHIYRLILNSRTYQRSSAPNEWNAADTAHFARYAARRLSAEQMLDAVSQFTETRRRSAASFPSRSRTGRPIRAPRRFPTATRSAPSSTCSAACLA